ncbi:MAG: T9SS type A sorting domain-containing protein [Chitinophagaceae bacterium]|nr:T9SS type A sorting domain-containing protein [Chitinophagaceae bacterium]MBK8299515.1 T9SS type A sorting domain-containing protein [Chitinophagaceae bacterium]MBK8299518.1 T9SS type A sorting domain-containing protein [Chitinophagaceae bacterium]
MRRRITLSCLAVFLAISFYSRAQVPSLNPINGVVPAILNAAGGTYDNASSYYRYEWSFGELLLIQAFAPPDSSILVTQGVLQPCTDQLGISAFTVLFDEGDYKLFPNPTSGKFEVDFFVRTPGLMSLQLVNSMGQVLMSKSYHYDGCCRIELFDISRYPNGVYFVVADLKPDMNRPGDNIQVIRHSGLKVIKLNEK